MITREIKGICQAISELKDLKFQSKEHSKARQGVVNKS